MPSPQPTNPIDRAAATVAASLTAYLAEEIAILLRRHAGSGRLPGVSLRRDRTAAARKRRQRARERDGQRQPLATAILSFGA